jgi:4-amino-4-deoxy-L-arabinose transferase-like glycosyltransferase
LKTWTQKISNGWIGVILIGFFYLLWLGIAVYFMDHYTKAEIENILVRWIPWNLRINALILLLVLIFCWPDIAGALKSFFRKGGSSGNETSEEPNNQRNQTNKTWLLIALLIFAFVLVTFGTTCIHRIYFDEDIYANIAQNIALTNQTGMCNYGVFEYGEYFVHWLSYNKEPSGWPFLISIVFQMFGTNELYAFLLNNMIYLGGILVVFFITTNLGGTWLQAFLAALIFALIPHNVIWSNTIAAEPSAALFSGLVILCFFIYFKTDARRHLMLLALFIPIACQMRAESGLIILWGLAAMLMLSPKMFLKKEAWFAGLVAAFFLLPHFLHLYAVSGHSWGAQGDKFSLAFLGKNLSTNCWYYLNNQHFPVIATVFALVGLLLSPRPCAGG